MLSPKEITEKIVETSIYKVRKPLLNTVLLGVLAGVFIGFGAVFYTIVKSDASYSFATKQLLGGFVFCVGLILVIVAGAELFTGNHLIITALIDKKIKPKELFSNWIVIFFSNLIGAVGLAVLIYYSGLNHHISETYLKMAQYKMSLSFEMAFLKGVLCNMLVCLAVWMAAAGKTLTDKVLAIIFPITLFVAAGFEHSIANLFILPLALIIDFHNGCDEILSLTGLFHNIIPVTLGNIVGGALFVGLIYSKIFLKKP